MPLADRFTQGAPESSHAVGRAAPLRIPPGSAVLSRLKLLVAIPALNEEATIALVISKIPRDVPGVASIQVLVIDDGSTDDTVQRAAAAGAYVIRHDQTLGVGAAFQRAIAYGIEARADLIVTIDADGQFNPCDIPKLIAPVVAGDADFSTASRFKDPALTPRMPRVKCWGNRLMSRLISRLTGQTFQDVSCGMRCYSRKAAVSLNLLGQFTYTQEVFLNLAFKRFRLVEVPIEVRGEREFGRSRVAGNLFRYAIHTLRIIFRCYRDYRPLRFFGMLAAMFVVPGVALGLFLLFHYLNAGRFSPHIWAGFVGASLLGLGLWMLHMGMLGDMLNRHRVYLEELLYRQRLDSGRDDEPR